MNTTSRQTQNHNEIKKCAEEQGGVPAKIKGAGDKKDEGVLRIHFPENSNDDDRFEQINWDDLFEKFDGNNLAFLYQDKKADGEASTFDKIVKHQ